MIKEIDVMMYYFEILLDIYLGWWIYVESRKRFESTEGTDIRKWNKNRSISYLLTLIFFVALNIIVIIKKEDINIIFFWMILLIVFLIISCLYRLYNNYKFFNTISSKDKVKLIGDRFIDSEV